MKTKEFKIVEHSHQIADTGDYDGCLELTNGKVSIFTKDDLEEEQSYKIINALNEASCDWYMDDSAEFELHLEKEHTKNLVTRDDYFLSSKANESLIKVCNDNISLQSELSMLKEENERLIKEHLMILEFNPFSDYEKCTPTELAIYGRMKDVAIAYSDYTNKSILDELEKVNRSNDFWRSKYKEDTVELVKLREENERLIKSKKNMN